MVTPVVVVHLVGAVHGGHQSCQWCGRLVTRLPRLDSDGYAAGDPAPTPWPVGALVAFAEELIGDQVYTSMYAYDEDCGPSRPCGPILIDAKGLAQ